MSRRSPVVRNDRKEDGKYERQRERGTEGNTDGERERKRRRGERKGKERDESRRFNSRWKAWMGKRTKEGCTSEREGKCSGRACVPDFWSRSMIFPKRTNEGGGLRMAAMELDLAGGRTGGEPGRTELEDAAVCSPSLSFSTVAHPRHRRLPPSPAFTVSTPFLPKYVSIYMRARDRVIPCDRIIPVCAQRPVRSLYPSTAARDAADRFV